MGSLFLRHKKRVEADPDAAKAVAAAARESVAPATGGSIGQQQKRIMLEDSLNEDLKRLHEIKSIERKVQVKREQLIPKYQPYVDGLRERGELHPLISQYLVWLFDVASMSAALDLGLYCDEHEIPLPERFNRNLRVFMADAMLEWAEREFDAGHGVEPYFGELFVRVTAEVDAWDVPDQLRAKYYRLQGFLCEAAGDIAAAVENLEAAYQLKAQVKTKLAQLKKQLEQGGE